MSAARKRPPANTYWRGGILWGRFAIRGRELKFSLHTSDGRLAAQRLAARRKLEIAAGHFGELRVPYSEAFIAWSAHIVDQIGEQTAKRYGVSLKQLEKDLLPLYVDEITRKKLGELIAERRKVVSVATVRRDLTALSSVLRFCMAQEWCESNPARAHLENLSERRDPIELPEHCDIETLIAGAPGMLANLARCLLATGCRMSELVAAKRSQFDKVRRQLTVIGKRNKLRVIDLEPFGAFDLFDSLPAYLGSPWLFWHDEGLPYRNVSSRHNAIANRIAADRAGAPPAADGSPFRKFSLHHLRHRHAVDWLKSGRNIYDLQIRLGHSSIKTTEIYLQYLTPDEIRVAKFGERQPESAHAR